MSNLRSGSCGDYYGSYFNESVSLTNEQQKVNVKYIYTYLKRKGWTVQAVSALCGNMQAESALNPGRWQSNDIGNTSMGYGLVQWTPATKYIDWCNGSDPSEMDNNLARIIYEVENKIQWYATDSYNLTFEEFTKSTDSPYNLAIAFLLNYERPADQSGSVQHLRGTYANQWSAFLGGVDDNEGTTTTTKRGTFNFILFNANKRRNKRWIKRS